MKQILAITRKELNTYISSPMALLFIGVFLVVTLVSFFGISKFFARGIADIRPLFQNMPLLLIFLIAALTMRQWSEEEQSGTLELLLTLPMKKWQLVLGKFFAVLILVIITLALTLSLPITVSFLGNLDWGTVIGGYLAAILLASAYIAIGLFISSLTDNSLVALMITAVVGLGFYLVGTTTVTDFLDIGFSETLQSLGTGSRFTSIERGVIDLRDLVYYLSITCVFLLLNIWALDRKRWSSGNKSAGYRFNWSLAIALVILNVIAFNLLIGNFRSGRVDLTQHGEYTLDPVTTELLNNLQEPLLIRGYFSEETHPLIAPVIPQVRDTLEEYAIAAGQDVQVEFIDPIRNPDLEQEANQTYGIRPTPLQVTDRGGTSLINAYFDILIRYGDQSETLNLLDMIDVRGIDQDIELSLRNLEYDLTSNIQRAVFGFQSVDSVFASLETPAQLTFYVTPDTLPEGFDEVYVRMQTIAGELAQQANGQLVVNEVNMGDPNVSVDPQALFDQYQIQPIATSFFSNDSYYLHIVIEAGDDTQVIYPTGAFSESEIRTSIESALKRSSPGFLQVVGIWTPPAIPQTDAFGQQQPPLQQYLTVADVLQQSYETRTVSLSDGQVPADIDALLVIEPSVMSDFERYAVDQYLMRGGSVFVLGGNYKIGVDQLSGNLLVNPYVDGLQNVLASYGITVEPALVMDLQNAPFPINVQRQVGDFVVNEVQALDYPFFVDVRPDGMNVEHPTTANIPTVTTHWASPILLDEEANANRTTTILLQSSPNSWRTTDTNIQPDLDLYPERGFAVSGTFGQEVVGVAVEGRFDSYFVDQPLPFENDTPEVTDPNATNPEATATPNPLEVAGFIEQSPSNARLVVISSSEMVNDTVFRVTGSFGDDRTFSNLQFIQNVLDWFVEDASLTSLRAQGSTARILRPLTEEDQNTWMYANFVFAVLSIIGIGILWQWRKRSEVPMELIPPSGEFTQS